MTTRDLHNNILASRAISPVAAADNTPLVSQIIDTGLYESLEFVIITGSLPDADATYTVLVEDGDDSGLADAAAVADAQLLGTEAAASFTFAADNSTRKIGYIGGKRYVRMTITPANLAAGAELIGAVAIQGHPRHAAVGAGATV